MIYQNVTLDVQQVVPHEMTSAEFAQYATTMKLVNHGRQWEVFVGDRSFGFSDAGTAEHAIKDVHKREVNNALYSNTPDAPDFMEKATMPPIRVMMEYRDLDEKFKDVFFLMRHKATWEAVAAISGDNARQGYEKAGLTFERDGRFAIVKKDGLSVAHMTPQFNRQQLYDAMIGNLQSGAQHIAGILENAFKELKVPEGYSFVFDHEQSVRDIASFRGKSMSAFVGLRGEGTEHLPDQLDVELRVFLDEPRAHLFAKKGPRFYLQNERLLNDKEPFFYAASYEALASNLVSFFNEQVLERAGLATKEIQVTSESLQANQGDIFQPITTWNTGREYGSAGQRIAAVILPSSGKVAFSDVDRGIYGVSVSPMGGPLAYSRGELKQFVMEAYDTGQYVDGFYGVPDIGDDVEASGFAAKLHLIAKEQIANESMRLNLSSPPELKREDLTNLNAPFMMRDGGIFDAFSGAALPSDWVGVVRRDVDGETSFMLIGEDNGERSFSGLGSLNYKDALDEADVLLSRLGGAVLNDRYADSIIGDRAASYNGLEIQGVRDLNPPGDPSGTCCEVDNENPQFYSVYAHLIPEGDNGGIECVGDFGTHALAVEYAVELGQQHGWDVRDFSKDGVRMSGQYSGAILAVDNGRVTQKVDRHGQTVSHLASLLSKDVQVGEVVDIKYHGGKGVVAAKDLGVGVGR